MSLLKQLTQVLQTQGEKLKHRKFMEASMATAALVATADGTVSFSERVAVDQILENVDALKIFDPHEAVDRFNHFVEAIQDNSAAGSAAALKAIEPEVGDSEAADLIMRIGCAISRADGDFSEAEITQIQAIADVLGIEKPDLNGQG